jgi:hypothetical protein
MEIWANILEPESFVMQRSHLPLFECSEKFAVARSQLYPRILFINNIFDIRQRGGLQADEKCSTIKRFRGAGITRGPVTEYSDVKEMTHLSHHRTGASSAVAVFIISPPEGSDLAILTDPSE